MKGSKGMTGMCGLEVFNNKLRELQNEKDVLLCRYGNDVIYKPEYKRIVVVIQMLNKAIEDFNLKEIHSNVEEYVKGATITLSPIETTLCKVDVNKLEKSVHEVLTKNWTDYIAKLESENPVELKKDFNIKSIPLQLLTKVNKDTSSKEIEHILNTIKSIEPSGVIKFSKEYTELTRLEGILENRIEENLKANEYKALEINVRLLQKIKEGYKPIRPIGCKA